MDLRLPVGTGDLVAGTLTNRVFDGSVVRISIFATLLAPDSGFEKRSTLKPCAS